MLARTAATRWHPISRSNLWISPTKSAYDLIISGIVSAEGDGTPPPLPIAKSAKPIITDYRRCYIRPDPLPGS